MNDSGLRWGPLKERYLTWTLQHLYKVYSLYLVRRTWLTREFSLRIIWHVGRDDVDPYRTPTVQSWRDIIVSFGNKHRFSWWAYSDERLFPHRHTWYVSNTFDRLLFSSLHIDVSWPMKHLVCGRLMPLTENFHNSSLERPTLRVLLSQTAKVSRRLCKRLRLT